MREESRLINVIGQLGILSDSGLNRVVNVGVAMVAQRGGPRYTLESAPVVQEAKAEPEARVRLFEWDKPLWDWLPKINDIRKSDREWRRTDEGVDCLRRFNSARSAWSRSQTVPEGERLADGVIQDMLRQVLTSPDTQSVIKILHDLFRKAEDGRFMLRDAQSKSTAKHLRLNQLTWDYSSSGESCEESESESKRSTRRSSRTLSGSEGTAVVDPTVTMAELAITPIGETAISPLPTSRKRSKTGALTSSTKKSRKQ